MPKTLVRVWDYGRTDEGLKVIKYTLVSAISGVISLVVLVVVFGVLKLWSEVFSTLFANVVAGFPSYFLNRQWVWGKSGRSHVWREIVPFWVMSIAGIIFALFMAAWAQHYSVEHHLSHAARTALVIGANVAAFAILWVLKFLIFNRLFAQIAEVEAGPE